MCVAKFPGKICEPNNSARTDLNWHSIIYLQVHSVLSFASSAARLRLFKSPWFEHTMCLVLLLRVSDKAAKVIMLNAAVSDAQNEAQPAVTVDVGPTYRT